MVRPHNVALQDSRPRSARRRLLCRWCPALASQVRLVPRAPRRLRPVAPGARASQAASPALAPLALRHRAQPTPTQPSPKGSSLEPAKFRGQVKGARERSRARGVPRAWRRRRGMGVSSLCFASRSEARRTYFLRSANGVRRTVRERNKKRPKSPNLGALRLGYGLTPCSARSDNGSEFIARVVRDGLALRGIKTLTIDPGSPWQNGFIESSNPCARRELLDRSSSTRSPRPASSSPAGSTTTTPTDLTAPSATSRPTRPWAPKPPYGQ
jgi:transposase InsO family protein